MSSPIAVWRDRSIHRVSSGEVNDLPISDSVFDHGRLAALEKLLWGQPLDPNHEGPHDHAVTHNDYPFVSALIPA